MKPIRWHTRAGGSIYLDGNSLGPLPRVVARRVNEAIDRDWGAGMVRSWNAAGWYESPGRLGRKLAPLLGAAPHQVTVTDTISVNLFKLLVAAVRLRPGRRTIVAEQGNFPSDNHIVGSVARLFGLTVRTVPVAGLPQAVDDDTAVAVLSHVSYRTAEIQDMARVTAAIQDRGALAAWDLAHSTGAVVLELDVDGADFAIGCGYKHLNGGPGAPSHVHIAERHLAGLDQPLTWLVRPRRTVPVRRRVRAGRRSSRHAVLDAADPGQRGAGGGARRLRRHRHAGSPGQGRTLGDLAIRLHDRLDRKAFGGVAGRRRAALESARHDGIFQMKRRRARRHRLDGACPPE